MAKAKLVTRSATTSTVTDDNLNKASALTHAEMDSNLINLRDSSFGIADDTSTVLQVTHDKTITVAGAGTVGTALSGDTLTITGSGITATSTDTLQNKTIDTANNTITITESDISDLGSYITASSTDTLTNKTFDANGTGNSISNIETADIAAATLVTAADTIASNNNDTTIPTSAAVKAYADSVGGGGGGSVGDLSIIGSTISAPSNGDLNLTTSGTGYVQLKANGGDFDNYTTQTRYANSNLMYWEDLDHTIANDRQYKNNIITNIKLTAGQDTSNSNDRWRQIFRNTLDLNGSSTTPTSTTLSRGVMGMDSTAEIKNTNSGTTSRLGNASGNQSGVLVDTNGGGNISFEAADSSSTNAGVAGNMTYVELLAGSGTTITIPKAINYYSTGVIKDGAGTASVTDSYAFYANANTAGIVTNEYGFYTADDSMINSIGGVTLQNGDVTTSAVSITDNLITTNRSNDNLNIEANGSGRVNIGSPLEDTSLYSGFFGNASRIKGMAAVYEDLAVNPNSLTDREYGHTIFHGTRITADSTNGNFRPRAVIVGSKVDLDGFSYTNTSNFRGPLGAQVVGAAGNTSATNSTINTVRGVESSATISDYSGSAGDITIVDAIGNFSANYIERDGTGDGNITNAYNFYATGDAYHEGSGSMSVTNAYGFYYTGWTGTTPTNQYAFYDATNSLSVFGDIQTQAVSITDNVITTNRSNDNLLLNSNGTGRIELSTDGGQLADSPTYPKYHFLQSNVKGVVLSRETSTDIDALTSREYGHVLHYGTTVTNGSSTNSNWNPRSVIFSSHTNMDGNDFTYTSSSRGPVGLFTAATANNGSGSSSSTLYNIRGSVTNAGIADYQGAPGQDMTITRCVGTSSGVVIETTGTSTNTITDAYNFMSDGYVDSAVGNTNTITNLYGFYHNASHGTNNYAFYDATNSLSRFGAVILANQAGDPSGVTDSAHIYAKDVASSSEVFVRDEAGNVTQISPHNEAGEWQYWSENIKTGKKVRVNMERMIRKLEEITGETFIESE